MKDFQIVEDINSFFRPMKRRPNVKAGVINILINLHNKNIAKARTSYNRKHWTSRASETTVRKTLEILTNYWMLTRVLRSTWKYVITKAGRVKVLKEYIYTLSTELELIVRDIVKNILWIAKWIEIKANNNLTEIKGIIKKMYKETKFIINKYWVVLFKIKWDLLKLIKNKDGLVMVKSRYWIMEWITFYNLYLKWGFNTNK